MLFSTETLYRVSEGDKSETSQMATQNDGVAVGKALYTVWGRETQQTLIEPQ